MALISPLWAISATQMDLYQSYTKKM